MKTLLLFSMSTFLFRVDNMKQVPVFKSLSRSDNFLKFGDTGHQCMQAAKETLTLFMMRCVMNYWLAIYDNVIHGTVLINKTSLLHHS